MRRGHTNCVRETSGSDAILLKEVGGFLTRSGVHLYRVSVGVDTQAYAFARNMTSSTFPVVSRAAARKHASCVLCDSQPVRRLHRHELHEPSRAPTFETAFGVGCAPRSGTHPRPHMICVSAYINDCAPHKEQLTPRIHTMASVPYTTTDIPSAFDPSSFILFTNVGKTCRHVLTALLASPQYAAKHPRIRVVVHSEGSAASLRAAFPPLPADAVLIGDVRELSVVRAAVAGGITHVFHVGPEFTPLEATIGINFMDEARTAGVRFFVFASALHPFRRKMINHRIKLDAEEYLAEARLPYCVLQPSDHMQNNDVKGSVEKGELVQLYSVEEKEAFLDLADLAEVAVKVLASPGEHNLARYELFGYALTYKEAAEALSRVSGKPVQARKLQREEALVYCEERARSRGEREYHANGFAMMTAYNDRYVCAPCRLGGADGMEPDGDCWVTATF